MKKIFTLFFTVLSLLGCTIKTLAQVNAADSLILVNLYNTTNGAHWANNSGWLTGPVHTWYGITLDPSLRVNQITLGGNNLSGLIPTSLGNLPDLGALVLGSNNLTGAIPASLGNTGIDNSLAYLDLSGNQLTGSIPYALGNDQFINTLYLNNNQLTGTIPGVLQNLSNLGDLELNNNQLSGNIPDSLQFLFGLFDLDLSTNNLTGNIPSWLGNLTSLNILNLYNNQLSGSIPPSLASLTSLNALNLSNNQLTGSIPSAIGSIPFLATLNLSINQLTGTIPSSLGAANLFTLDLSSNQLSGTVPASFSNLQSGTTLIDNNQLTFAGLENAVTSIPPGQLVDSPQAIIPITLTGSTLSAVPGGTLSKDTFNWYGDGVLDTTIIGNANYTPTFVGHYYVLVSNNIVTPATGLILHSDTLLAGVVLPVTFINFTGALVDKNALLQWQTASELNASYFNVQRSTDGINFIDIGKVDAKGNSSSTINYQFTDNLATLTGQPLSLTYRLQEIDKNGAGEYSKIVNILLSNQLVPVTIYPNPVTDNLNISFGSISGNTLITVFNVSGTKVLQQQQTVLPGNKLSINAAGLATGTYFLRISSGNGTVTEQRFVKQ